MTTCATLGAGGAGGTQTGGGGGTATTTRAGGGGGTSATGAGGAGGGGTAATGAGTTVACGADGGPHPKRATSPSVRPNPARRPRFIPLLHAKSRARIMPQKSLANHGVEQRVPQFPEESALWRLAP